MSTSAYPRLSVTLSVFTAFDSSHPRRPGAAQLELGEGATEDFGMGLFVVTRKSNDDDVYQQDPTGKRVIPASLVLSEEQLEDTAKRILVEELGLDVTYKLRQNRIFDEINPSDRQRVGSINFWTFVHVEALAPLLGGRDQVGLELVSSSDFLTKQEASQSLDELDGISRFGYRIAPELPQGHFKYLTRIEDVILLHEDLKAKASNARFDPDMEVECEDGQGNVMPQRVYKDLIKQGLI